MVDVLRSLRKPLEEVEAEDHGGVEVMLLYSYVSKYRIVCVRDSSPDGFELAYDTKTILDEIHQAYPAVRLVRWKPRTHYL